MNGPLERECDVFTRYLTGLPADGYIRSHYDGAHRLLKGVQPRTPLDRLLVGCARRGRLATQAADAYGRIFAPRGALRHKLVLLFGILESRAPHHRSFEVQRPSGPLAAVAGLIREGAVAGLILIAATMVLGPIHAALRLRGETALPGVRSGTS